MSTVSKKPAVPSPATAIVTPVPPVKKPTARVPAKAVKPLAKTVKTAPIVIETNRRISKSDKVTVSKSTSKAAAPAKVAKAVKPVKPKKIKMVRDSLSMPKDEYAVLDTLKLRAAKLGAPIKKTELLRAGIKALAAMSDTAFTAALKAVPNLKTGRPAKGE
jgi:hypothetical protein